MNKDQYWTDYWKNEGETGEVFVNKKGEKPEYLSQQWESFFKELSPELSIMDIACGAGSIFQALEADNKYKLIGTDVSQTALNKLKENFEDIQALTCSSDEIPLADNEIDVVVSQFGVEYSGEAGFQEALRVLKPLGKFNFIVHYENGFIDQKNQIQLEGVRLVDKLDFVEKAKAVTIALNDKALFEQAFKAFSAVEPVLFDYCEKFPQGIHSHLYSGFRKLLTEREKYHTSDILGWLEAMEQELNVNNIRLSSMCDASFSLERVDALAKILSPIADIQYTPFFGEDKSLPIAWHISGAKK